MGVGIELLRLARRLSQLLQDERDLNDRLSAFAMGMQEASVVTNDELNALMGLSWPAQPGVSELLAPSGALLTVRTPGTRPSEAGG